MRWLTVSLAALALALAGVGCGGSDEESSATTDTATLTETAPEETATAEETTEATDTDVSGAFGGEDCLELVSASTTLSQALGGASGNDPEDAAKVFEAFAEKVPEEIRDEFRTFADAWTKAIAALGAVGIEPGTTPTAEQSQQYLQALESLNTPEVSAASQRLEAWTQENCPGG